MQTFIFRQIYIIFFNFKGPISHQSRVCNVLVNALFTVIHDILSIQVWIIGGEKHSKNQNFDIV